MPSVKMMLWMPDKVPDQMSDEDIRATPVYRQLRQQLSIPYRGRGKPPEQPDAERVLLLAARTSIAQLHYIMQSDRDVIEASEPCDCLACEEDE